jgi:hypothetical protein
MSESEGGGGLPTDFLSTHPANEKRIKVRALSAMCWAVSR